MKKFFKRLFQLILLLILIAVALIFYAIKVEPYQLTINEQTIKANLKDNLKIVFFTDVQISDTYTVKEFDKVVQAINAQDADLVLFGGDLYDIYNEYHDNKNLSKKLKQIKAKEGKYAILGNRDLGGGFSYAKYNEVLNNGGFTTLINEGVNLKIKSDQIFLGGVDDSLLGVPNLEQSLTYQNTNSDYRILLTHEPDSVDKFLNNNVDLFLAGHSHGGQVIIPFLKTYQTAMAQNYNKGLYELEDKSLLYVSSGIGTSHLPIRFLVTPEIVVMNIT